MRIHFSFKIWSRGLIGGAMLLAAAGSYAQLPDTDGKGALYGKPAPAFQLKGIYGETYSLEQLKGNILVIQFGTSW